ncbi:hypothetical protein R1sor_024357 [Riccia sorocarpa]|uniref:Uncharacterized protein n=1 Tax=Riccia sorocarpa TaxID=122646 RepID=A0ABD3GUD7_9MARC
MAKSKRRRSRTLESCERQASLSKPGEVSKRREVPVDQVEMEDDTLKECHQQPTEDGTEGVRELHPFKSMSSRSSRACDVKFERELTELEERYRAALLRSREREEALKTQINNLEKERDKQAEIIESYGNSRGEVLDLSMRNCRHEEVLRIPGTPSRSTGRGRDPQSKDLEISALKDELTRVRAALEVSEFRLGLERKQKG